MTDPEQIPHLVKLLDDDSHDVRKAVAKELAAFGPTLKTKFVSHMIKMNLVEKFFLFLKNLILYLIIIIILLILKILHFIFSILF